VALVSYGSEATGRADAWSDIDVVAFIRSADHPAFVAGWKEWIGRLPGVLHAYEAGSSPRVICNGTPCPIRIDLAWWSDTRLDEIATWSQPSPRHLDDMVLLDRSLGGRCTALVSGLTGPVPLDDAHAYAHFSGDLWYYLLRVHGLMQRGDELAARTEFHWFVLDNLARLHRLEAGTCTGWQTSLGAKRLAQLIEPAYLSAIYSCIPGSLGLRQSLRAASRLGADVCRRMESSRGWPWPVTLATEVDALLDAYP
jgi:hypothetical protein